MQIYRKEDNVTKWAALSPSNLNVRYLDTQLGTNILDKYNRKIMEICEWVDRFRYGCEETSGS